MFSPSSTTCTLSANGSAALSCPEARSCYDLLKLEVFLLIRMNFISVLSCTAPSTKRLRSLLNVRLVIAYSPSIYLTWVMSCKWRVSKTSVLRITRTTLCKIPVTDGAV